MGSPKMTKIMTREAGTQAHEAVCAEGICNVRMGPTGLSLLSTYVVLPCTAFFPHLISSSLLSAPRYKALLPPYTDEDLEAGSEFSSVITYQVVESGLKTKMQALFSSLPHLPVIGEELPSWLSEKPLGSVLRALYQQHPLKLSLLHPFPFLPLELNTQQISDLNLEWGHEAFGAR